MLLLAVVLWRGSAIYIVKWHSGAGTGATAEAAASVRRLAVVYTCVGGCMTQALVRTPNTNVGVCFALPLEGPTTATYLAHQWG
jgi:hypothetical protein